MIQVSLEEKDRFRVRVRGHEMVVDQPLDMGGDDLGPTPTELFVVSLATCVAFYVERFLRRNGLRADGLEVATDHEMAERPARVGSVRMRITLPSAVPDDKAAALIRVAEHCTVHNTITQAPDVRIALEPAVRAA